MATVPAPAKAAPSTKYDVQVLAQLAKAEQRVRFLDLVTGLLGFLTLSLGFALVVQETGKCHQGLHMVRMSLDELTVGAAHREDFVGDQSFVGVLDLGQVRSGFLDQFLP